MSDTTVTWKQGLTLPHDPDDTADITVDMTAVVGTTGDTLSSADVTAVGVTGVEVSASPAGVVVFRVSGGTAGEDSSVTTKITMASGRVQSRTINFNVLER